MRGAGRFYLAKLRAQVGRLEAERALQLRFPSLRLAPNVHVVSPDRLEVEANVLVQAGAVLHCGGLAWSGGDGHIAIGRDTVISHQCVLFGAGGIDIGARFECGPGTMVFSSQTAPGAVTGSAGAREHRFGRVRIGDDVTLYAGVIVTPGVSIGDGAAVAAGAVVVGDVPARTLYGGVPARKLRDLG